MPELTQTSFGYVVTCTGGTSVPAVLVNKNIRVRVNAIICGGAATTDITLIQDANGRFVYTGSALVNVVDKFTPKQSIELDGLSVGFTGATTGFCNIFLGD